MSNAFVTIKVCYVYNQWYEISCATLYYNCRIHKADKHKITTLWYSSFVVVSRFQSKFASVYTSYAVCIQISVSVCVMRRDPVQMERVTCIVSGVALWWLHVISYFSNIEMVRKISDLKNYIQFPFSPGYVIYSPYYCSYTARCKIVFICIN